MSGVVTYHLVALLLSHASALSIRNGGLQRLGITLGADRYVRITGNEQNWGMFANPHQEDTVLKLYVQDTSGYVWDLAYDRRSSTGSHWQPSSSHRAPVTHALIHGRRYRTPFVAWVCREWERAHGGDPAKRVRIVNETYALPAPSATLPMVGFDRTALPRNEQELASLECAQTVNGQLPNRLRRRYQLPETEGSSRFKPVQNRSWKAEQDRRSMQKLRGLIVPRGVQRHGPTQEGD